jgi:hypothetical protein
MTTHITRFYRCPDEPGLFRAVCTCGWSIQGDLKTIQTRAATHDLDEPVHEAPLKKMGFVSGLPNKLIGNDPE